MRALTGIVCLAFWCSSAQAAFVSYFMNQSNLNPVLADGTNFAQVTIDDNTANTLRFTVTLLPPLTSIAGTNFGIQDFGFNVLGTDPLADASSTNAQWILPSGFSANVTPPPNQLNGFGRFEVGISATGTNRASPLVFSILNTGLGLTSFEELSTGGAVEGNVFFSAHVAGFTLNGVDSSGFVGGSTPVPLPSSLLLFPAGLAMLGLRRRERRL